MTLDERASYIASIEDSISFIVSQQGNSDTVDFILGKYGVSYPDELRDSDLMDAFSEIYAVDADLR